MSIPALTDARFQIGAYIRDDETPAHLYYVLGEETTGSRGLIAAHVAVLCENCATGYTAPLEPLYIRRHCTLVPRTGPAAPASPPAAGWRFP